MRLFWGVILTLLCLTSAAVAQRQPRPDEIGALVYEQLPNLPRENTYIGVRSREVRPNDTFVSRLVRYHQQLQNRRLGSRLDWKITIADLLGVNGVISPEQYPGFETLTPNPLEGDLTVLTRLSRAERDRLIDAILAVVPRPQLPADSPEDDAGITPPSPAAPALAPSSNPQLPPLPRSGAADLLR